VPLLQAEIESGTGDEARVAPGVKTDKVDETAQLVSEPVTTSEYWKVNSAFWLDERVTSAAGCDGGPERFTVNPFTTVVGTVAPLALYRVKLG
jgi:hypothetical protein